MGNSLSAPSGNLGLLANPVRPERHLSVWLHVTIWGYLWDVLNLEFGIVVVSQLLGAWDVSGHKSKSNNLGIKTTKQNVDMILTE